MERETIIVPPARAHQEIQRLRQIELVVLSQELRQNDLDNLSQELRQNDLDNLSQLRR
jgi:hypothetical protein